MIAPIDWQRVARATKFYPLAFDYQPIETPWVVSMQAAQVTFPDPVALVNGKVPVGSAEQGFIELLLKGGLKPGKYLSAGPCFRPVDEGKWMCQPWFFKVELIHVFGPEDVPTDADVLLMLVHAKSFFRHEVAHAEELKDERTNEGWDLCINGVEVGSYGYRTFEGHRWVYGTGLAEPRCSLALEQGDWAP